MNETATIHPLHPSTDPGDKPAPYLTQLGLTLDPFSNDLQQDFFLLDSDRAQRLNMLFHLVQDSELLLLVTGVQGSGKTSLLHRFLDMGNDSWRTCIIDANAMMNPDQLLTQIAEGFGLPQDSVNFNTVFEQLNKRLTEMKLGELLPILIIDDAHELPAASLTILMKLSELAEHDERLLRIVLFSEPQISTILNSQELHEVRHRITHSLDIPKLTEEQTRDYINYRMSVAGLKNDVPFTRSQIIKIYRLSNGIPGKINLHAHEILLTMQHGVNAQSDISWPVRLRGIFSIVIILGIAGGVTWILARDSINNILTTQSTTPETTSTAPAATTANGKTTLPLLPPTQPKSAPDPELAHVPSINEPPAGNNNIAAPETKTSTEVSATSPTSTAIASSDTTANPYALSNTAQVKAPTADNTTPATTKPVVKPAPPPAAKPTTISPVAKASDNHLTPKPAAAKPATKIKKPLAAKPVPKVIVKPKPWLARQNPNHFTLQLMGSRNKAAVEKLIKSQGLGKKTNIIRTQLQGADWYILLYSHYPTIEVARAAIKTLPKGVQQYKPWPRKIGDIAPPK